MTYGDASFFLGLIQIFMLGLILAVLLGRGK